jgi:hypothetical protein
VTAVLVDDADGEFGGVAQLLDLGGVEVDQADDVVVDGGDEEDARLDGVVAQQKTAAGGRSGRAAEVRPGRRSAAGATSARRSTNRKPSRPDHSPDDEWREQAEESTDVLGPGANARSVGYAVGGLPTSGVGRPPRSPERRSRDYCRGVRSDRERTVSSSGPVRPTRIDVDGVDRADVDTEHAVDALGLVGRVGLGLAFGVAGRVHPLEDVHRAVLEAGAVGQADVEVDGDVGPVDAQFVRFVDWSPDLVAAVLVYDLAVLLELGIYGHWYLVALRRAE